MCEMLPAQLPQQEQLLELRKGEGDAEGLVCRRTGSDRALAAPERWRNDPWIDCTPCQHGERASPGLCMGLAAAGTGKGSGVARKNASAS